MRTISHSLSAQKTVPDCFNARRGQTSALTLYMRITLPHFCNAVLLSAALIAPIALTPTTLRAEDQKGRTYHDKKHNDDHEWNGHEDQAYGMWTKQNHRKVVEFTKLKPRDQESYWAWRHQHSDADLKIEIR
jgi:hypothetical protein